MESKFDLEKIEKISQRYFVELKDYIPNEDERKKVCFNLINTASWVLTGEGINTVNNIKEK